MSNFLQQLRDKARERENQSAAIPSATQANASDARSADADGGSAPSTSESGVSAGVRQDGADAGARDRISAPTESPSAPATTTQAPTSSFLARLAGNRGAIAPTVPSVPAAEPAGETSIFGGGSDSESTLGDEAGEALSSDDSNPEGLGDAPVNAATVVEGEAAGAADSGATLADLFRARLAALDSLCQAESGITPLIHDTVKSHVKAIMVDLRENPEMRGLLLDKDMHNIMLFIQSSTQVQDAKVEKVAVKREKKAKTSAISGAFDDAFASLDAVPSLADLGNRSTDNIESKVR